MNPLILHFKLFRDLLFRVSEIGSGCFNYRITELPFAKLASRNWGQNQFKDFPLSSCK